MAPVGNVKPGGQLAPRPLALARVARQPHLGVGNLFTVVVLAIERLPVVAAKDEGHGRATGGARPAGLVRSAVPAERRRDSRRWSRPSEGTLPSHVRMEMAQDAGELKIAGRAAIHVRAIEEWESDAIEAVVGRRVDRDRRVLARALEDFR